MYAFKVMRGTLGNACERFLWPVIERNHERPITCLLRRFYADKREYDRKLPHCNTGAIGHVDHGKTTLVSAITKYLSEQQLSEWVDCNDIDDDPEERARGMSMRLSYVEFETGKRHYAHIDCPGHVDYVNEMINGTSEMDGLILVVAATDGVMSQTQEHLWLAKYNGVKQVIVFINKVDAVEKEIVDLVEIEVRDLLRQAGFDSQNVPVIRGSALCALKDESKEIGIDSIAKLVETIDSHISIEKRDTNSPFIMNICNVLVAKGRGTVATGFVVQGKLKSGDECEIIGYNKCVTSTIHGAETFQKTLKVAQAGDQIGVLLQGVKSDEIRRGMVMAKPGTVQPIDQVEANFYIFRKDEVGRERPITSATPLYLFSRTWDCDARICVPKNEMITPGNNATLTIKLMKPMVLQQGQRFTVRDNKGIIGTGVVTKVKDPLTRDERLDLFVQKKLRAKKLERRYAQVQ